MSDGCQSQCPFDRLRASFDAQAHRFHNPEPTAVHDLRNEFVYACHAGDDAFDLLFRQNRRHVLCALGAKFRQAGFVQSNVKDVTIEEKDGA